MFVHYQLDKFMIIHIINGVSCQCSNHSMATARNRPQHYRWNDFWFVCSVTHSISGTALGLHRVT